MIKNYLKIAWRNLWKNKFFSILNISGLALGMACSLLIALWVQNELAVDNFHANGSRLFAVFERQYYDRKVTGQYSTPGILANELKKVIPEVQYAAQLGQNQDHTFRVGDKILKLNGSAASADFFKMFSYPLLQGNASSALNSPLSIAISRKMADDFFGGPQNAMDKTLRYENQKDFKVTAVFEDILKNSSEKFDFLIDWDDYVIENDWIKQWNNNGPHTYVLLRPDADAAIVNKKIARFMDVYNKPTKSFREEIGLQKFGEVFLNSDFKEGKPSGGRIEYVHLFTIVAIFILLIACINFMNLTTARSVKRAKEIGIRKVIGAIRIVLFRQFIGEALMLTFIAIGVACFLVLFLLPEFNTITQKEISYPFTSATFWLWLAGLTLVIGFFSGCYPALFLSSFSPIKVLKGTQKTGAGATWLRKGLVVFQFSLSVILIIGTIVVSKQVRYIQTKDLGYDRENLIYVPLEGDLFKNYEIFKDEALKTSSIKQVTCVTNTPTDFGSSTGGVNWDGKDPNLNVEFTFVSVGYDFTKTMKVQMASGRDFSRDFPADTNNYIVNESALKRIGYADPIGRSFTMWGKKGVIVGVVKDFHFNSLRDPIFPLVVKLREKNKQFGSMLIRTQPGYTPQAIATISKLCKELNPNFAVTYQFSDLEYQKLYNNEQIVGKLADAFAFLGIFISSLGLLGLAMFTAEQRVKEIGIRKVLGASVGSLFKLLSQEFLILVIIALVIAMPVAWYAMDKWLEGYSYKTPIEWWMFTLSAIIAILIALLTVSFQAVKVALVNPVKSLRNE